MPVALRVSAGTFVRTTVLRSRCPFGELRPFDLAQAPSGVEGVPSLSRDSRSGPRCISQPPLVAAMPRYAFLRLPGLGEFW